MKKFLIIVAAICTAGILGVIALVAMLGAAASSVDSSIKAEQKNDRPAVIAEGAAFTHDGYKVDKGWTLGTDPYGMPVIRDLQVTNVGHSAEQDTPMFTFSLWAGKQSLAEIDATGHQIAKGQSTAMDAFSADTVKGTQIEHATIKVADVW